MAKAEIGSTDFTVARYCSMLSRVAKVSWTGCSSAHSRTLASMGARSLSGTAQRAMAWMRSSRSFVVASTMPTPGPKASFPSGDSR